jgi:hypothetical protein
VRAVNRSGRAELPDAVEVVAADAANPAEARRVCREASVVYHCANPPYAKWPQLHPPLMDAIIKGAGAAGPDSFSATTSTRTVRWTGL